MRNQTGLEIFSKTFEDITTSLRQSFDALIAWWLSVTTFALPSLKCIQLYKKSDCWRIWLQHCTHKKKPHLAWDKTIFSSLKLAHRHVYSYCFSISLLRILLFPQQLINLKKKKGFTCNKLGIWIIFGQLKLWDLVLITNALLLFMPLTTIVLSFHSPILQLSWVQALEITFRNGLIQQIICLLWAHLCLSFQTLLQVEFSLISHDSVTLECNDWGSTLDHLTIICEVMFFMVRLLQKPPSPPSAYHGNAYFICFFQ